MWERYLRLSREVSAERPELIVWPSSSVPSLIPTDVLAAQRARTRSRARAGRSCWWDPPARRRGGPALASSPSPTRPSCSRRGAASQVATTRSACCPSTSTCRCEAPCPGRAWIARDMQDADAGTERTVFRVDERRFGVLICWENMFGGAVPRDGRERRRLHGEPDQRGLHGGRARASPALRHERTPGRRERRARSRAPRRPGCRLRWSTQRGGDRARPRRGRGDDLDVEGFLVRDLPLRGDADALSPLRRLDRGGRGRNPSSRRRSRAAAGAA